MPFSIQKKVLLAFFTVITLLMAVVGLVSIYNQFAYHESQEKVELIYGEMEKTSRLGFAMEKALMPANDYLITGDKQYEIEFQRKSESIEKLLKDVESTLVPLEGQGARAVDEEKKILGDIREAWKNMREISLRIFAVREPVGNAAGADLMEEMDYKWGRLISKSFETWHEMETNELQEAVEGGNAAWKSSWIIMSAAFVALIVVGVSLSLFYSRKFVRPITELQKSADIIAGGNLDYRVDVSTGDEIEHLAGQFNVMGEKLKESYAILEGKVMERTKELQYEKDKLVSVFNAMVDGVCIVNRDYDVEYVNPVLEKEFGSYHWKKCYEYFNNSAGVCPWCPNQEVFTGKTVRWEWYSSKNNKTYDLVDTPLRKPDGSILKLEMFRDVTEKKRSEEELKSRLNELERFRATTIGREFRMKELRDEIHILRKKLQILEERG